MALPAANNAEGGSNGTTVTVGNSGGASGAPWDVVNLGGTSTLKYDTAQAAHGALSYKVVTQSGNACYLNWGSATLGANGTIYGRLYLYVAANPAIDTIIMRFLSGAITCSNVRLTTTGTVVIVDNGGTAQATSTTTVNLNGWTRLEYTFTFSTTTGSGSVSIFTSPDSTTAAQTISCTNKNFGASTADTARFGVVNFPAAITTLWLDSLQVNATGLPGPDVAAAVSSPTVLVAPSRAAIQAASW